MCGRNEFNRHTCTHTRTHAQPQPESDSKLKMKTVSNLFVINWLDRKVAIQLR